jgi:predicted MFS family arabinose efflux permease
MDFNGMFNQLAIEIGEISGKHLFGSLFSDGSLAVIGAIAAVAIISGIIIFLRKKNKGNK